MAVLTQAQIDKVVAAIHWAYSIDQIPIGWTKPEINPEVVAIDVWRNDNAVAANQTFSAAFRGKSSVNDRVLILICDLIARHLADSPTQLSVLRNLINRLV